MTFINKCVIINIRIQTMEKKMFDRWLNVLSKNLGYTIVFVVAVVFFMYFSEGLIPGLIAAVSAVLAFTCGAMLYKEYKNTPAVKTVNAKAVKKTPSKKRNKK